MIGKSLILALFGIAATPRVHNEAVHDAHNEGAMAQAGFARTARDARRTFRTLKNEIDAPSVKAEMADGHELISSALRSLMERMR